MCAHMMVNVMRSNQRWLWILVSAVVSISFISFYSDRTHSDALGTDHVGKIYGRTLTATELQRTARQLRIAMELGLTNLTGREIFEGGDLSSAALNNLVLQHEAEKRDIVPTDDEVLNAEMSMTAFQGANGQFDPTKKDEVMADRLTPNGFSPNQLDELVRQDLQVGKLREIVVAPVVVSPLEVRRAYERSFAKTEASVIRFKKEDFTATVPEPSADEVKKYFDEQKDRFIQPERRKVQYVKFGLDDAQKKLAGKEKMDALKPLADQAYQFLEQLLDQKGKAKAGEDFAKAATAAKLPVKESGEFEVNQIPAGEEGAIPGFGQAASKLTNADPDSDVPLQGTDAYYDLHLGAMIPERPLTLDEARPKVIAAIKDERATAALAAKAEETRGKIEASLKAGHLLPDAAKESGQSVEELSAFSQAAPATGVPDASVAASAAQDLGVGELSKFVPTATGGLLVYVRHREGIDEVKFDQEKARGMMNLQRQKAAYYFYEWLRATREAAGARLDNRFRS